MRISDIEGVSVTPADRQDSFLCCYLPSKITRLPAQYPLLFSSQGQTSRERPTCEAVRQHLHQQTFPHIRNQLTGERRRKIFMFLRLLKAVFGFKISKKFQCFIRFKSYFMLISERTKWDFSMSWYLRTTKVNVL